MSLDKKSEQDKPSEVDAINGFLRGQKEEGLRGRVLANITLLVANHNIPSVIINHAGCAGKSVEKAVKLGKRLRDKRKFENNDIGSS